MFKEAMKKLKKKIGLIILMIGATLVQLGADMAELRTAQDERGVTIRPVDGDESYRWRRVRY